MDCRDVQNRLFDLLEGRLDGQVRARMERHLDGCDDCAELAGALRGEALTEDAALTGSILARTSGAPCERAGELLPGWVDGMLPPVETELMRGHLGGCRACAALAGALQHMAEELPELAEVEVDDAFVGDVLAATLPHHVRAKRRLDAWTERLQRLLSRPRIAWEGAYLLTTFVVLLFGTPGSPFANVSKKALAIARTDPYTIQRPVVQLENRVSQGLQNAWQSTEVGVRSLAGDVAVQSNSAYGNIREEFGTLWLRLASEQGTTQQAPSAHQDEPDDGERDER